MKKHLKILAMAIVAVFLVVGSAWATPINLNRPLSLPAGSGSSEPTLQKVFNDTFTPTIDAYFDQSSVAIWTPAEAAVDSYLITLLSAKAGKLGIYSDTTGLMQNLDLGSDNATSFNINDAGDLYVNSSLAQSGFGHTFGFYWDSDTGLTSYTEDDKNVAGTGYGPNHDILALSYLVPDGTVASLPKYSGGTTVTLRGDNDWALAFEDWAASSGGDGDFQDAVFLVEDMDPVPEPGTVLLLGIGLIGLAGLGRKKLMKK